MKYFDERVLNFSLVENVQQRGRESLGMKIRGQNPIFLTRYSLINKEIYPSANPNFGWKLVLVYLRIKHGTDTLIVAHSFRVHLKGIRANFCVSIKGLLYQGNPHFAVYRVHNFQFISRHFLQVDSHWYTFCRGLMQRNRNEFLA